VIAESGPLSHQKVADVTWPEGCVLVALVRGSEALVPGPGDVMAPGDTVYALVAKEAKKAFTNLLQS
jgi:Trk K+ transport system NAD-binding subunit